MNSNTYTERKKYILRQIGQILGIGFAYFVITGITGIYLPCPFKLITGLKCPGCGMTHYALALLHGNIHEAYDANPLLFWLIPLLLAYGTYRAIVYIKKGKTGFNIPESILLSIAFIITIGFGIYRNIMHI